jgi:hypothetical protein
MRVTGTVSSADQVAAADARFRQNDTETAEALLRDVLVRDPAREDAAMLLARVLQSCGRMGAAARALLVCCEANAFDPQLCLRCVRFVRQCDRHRIAEHICREALARRGVVPELLLLAGHVARESGDFAAARLRYQAALEAGIDLGRHHVFGALANTRRYAEASDPEIARFAAHFADIRYSLRSRASAGYAFAKAQDDLANYAGAARALRDANAMVHAAQPWNVSAWYRFVTARKHERIASRSMGADSVFRPVFIVGVPRTGTTLTASLLARATGARDRGELRALRFIAEQLVAGNHLGSRLALDESADLYRMLAVQDDEPAPYYLDQDPLNFRWLHIAAAMFPQARVIHLHRSPRDTALSLWCQDFAHPVMAFAYGFDTIAAFMTGEDELMRHWCEALPVPVFDLEYENLVGDADATLARLREFIGAPARVIDTAVPEGAPVQSASVWQARQPVYTTSVGRWRHYLPFEPGLARFAESA